MLNSGSRAVRQIPTQLDRSSGDCMHSSMSMAIRIDSVAQGHYLRRNLTLAEAATQHQQASSIAVLPVRKHSQGQSRLMPRLIQQVPCTFIKGVHNEHHFVMFDSAWANWRAALHEYAWNCLKTAGQDRRPVHGAQQE